MRNVTMDGRRISVLGDPPSENAAEAVLGLLHDWSEMSDWCSLEELAIKYKFADFTLQMALRALKARGLIEVEDRKFERKFLFLIPYMDSKTYCRRVSTGKV